MIIILEHGGLQSLSAVLRALILMSVSGTPGLWPGRRTSREAIHTVRAAACAKCEAVTGRRHLRVTGTRAGCPLSRSGFGHQVHTRWPLTGEMG